MKQQVVGLALLLAIAAALGEQSTAADRAYRELYEQGYYEEAIGLLDSLVMSDSGTNPERVYYLAACHIARGDRDKGAMIFGWLLANDSSYTLDSIYTPPKIFEVFRDVKVRTLQIQTVATTIDTLCSIIPSTDSGMVLRTAADTRDGSKLRVDTLASSFSGGGNVRGQMHPAHSWPPGLLPYGGGQFLQRKPVKGALLCVMQAASLGICVWATHTREGFRDDRYGWYDGNLTAWNRYTAYTRVGATLLLGSYAYGVIDYFYGLRKNRSGK